MAQEITAKANSIVLEDEAREENNKIRTLVDKTTQKAFDKALNNGIHAVSVALKGSTHDGDDKQFPKVLKSLSLTAKTIWGKIIIKEI